jgi:hypothetical protein
MQSFNISEEAPEVTGLEQFEEHEAKKVTHRKRRDSRERDKKKEELSESKRDRSGGKHSSKRGNDEDYE